MIAAELLGRAGQERPGHVFEGDERDIEKTVTEADRKRAGLGTDALMSRQPARCAGWLADEPTGRPPNAPKADHDIGRVVRCTSKK